MSDERETGLRERPVVTSGCSRCKVAPSDTHGDHYAVVISPTGRAHYGGDYGATACGIDATGDGWWWPL